MKEHLGTLAYNGFILAVAKAHKGAGLARVDWDIMATWAHRLLKAGQVLASYSPHSVIDCIEQQLSDFVEAI